MIAVGSYVRRAEELADIRYDSDIPAKACRAWAEGHFILVDVQYHSKGYCALYEFNLQNGSAVLAQD